MMIVVGFVFVDISTCATRFAGLGVLHDLCFVSVVLGWDILSGLKFSLFLFLSFTFCFFYIFIFYQEALMCLIIYFLNVWQARAVSTDRLRPSFYTINGVVYVIQVSSCLIYLVMKSGIWSDGAYVIVYIIINGKVNDAYFLLMYNGSVHVGSSIKAFPILILNVVALWLKIWTTLLLGKPICGHVMDIRQWKQADEGFTSFWYSISINQNLEMLPLVSSPHSGKNVTIFWKILFAFSFRHIAIT